MDETLHARSNLDECAVVGHDDDLALDLVANLEVGIQGIPGMGSELLQSEGDALLLLVEVEDDDVELLVELHNLLRIADAAPAEVCDVDETIDTTEVDEHTVGGDVLDSALEHLTLLQLGDDFFLLCLQLGLDEGLVADDDIAIFLIDLHDLELHRLANEDIVVADGLDINLAAGQECLDAKDVNNHATLGAALDVTLDDFLILQSGIDALPTLGGTCLLVGENELTLLVLLILDIHLYNVTDLQLGIVAELTDGDDAVALVADVHDYLTLVDANDRAIYDIVVIDACEALVISCLLLLTALRRLRCALLVAFPVEVVEGLNVLCFCHL